MSNKQQELFSQGGSKVTYTRDEDNVKLLSDSEACVCIINRGEDSELKCYAFEQSQPKCFLYCILGLLSGCSLFLFGYWFPNWRLCVTHNACPLREADTVLIQDVQGNKSLCKVRLVPMTNKKRSVVKSMVKGKTLTSEVGFYRIFVYNFLKYVWDTQKKTFVELNGLDQCISVEKLKDKLHGVSKEEREARLRLFGPNRFDVQLKSKWRILIEQVLEPLYLFLLLNCIVMALDKHTILASCIFILWILVIVLQIRLAMMQLNMTRKAITQTEAVRVLRSSGNTVTIESSPSDALVPGDVLVLDAKCRIPCDAALLRGSCIVSEAHITGQSKEVLKVPLRALNDDPSFKSFVYSRWLCSECTLYSGSEVLEIQDETASESTTAYAVVVCTGFATSKGRLLRRILGTNPLNLARFGDSMKFVILVVSLSACGIAYHLSKVLLSRVSPYVILHSVLRTVASSVPPTLPLALAFSGLMLVQKLTNLDIACFDLSGIDTGGRVSLVCFDKTGTLTEAKQSLSSVVSVKDNKFEKYVPATCLNDHPELLKAAVSCHTLTLVGDNVMGEPLDVETFKRTGWNLRQPEKTPDESTIAPIHFAVTRSSNSLKKADSSDEEYVSIWKQFHFNSNLKRMSVVATDQNGDFIYVYVRGAPEVVRQLCVTESVPTEFDQCLENLTLCGYRVIAYATKREAKPKSFFFERLKTISREEVETRLRFLGFLVFENSLHHGVKDTVGSLNAAGIRTIMITGDELGTASSIARKCGILAKKGRIGKIVTSGHDCLTFEEIKFPDVNIGGDYISHENKSNGFSMLIEEEREELLKEQKKHDTDLEKFQHTIDIGSLGTSLSSITRSTHIHQLALTGNEIMHIREKHPQDYKKILMASQVFARMSPDQKAILIYDLKGMGYRVCMCGDGLNDCLALKAADMSISLSSSEPSIVSIFQCTSKEVHCVTSLVREGRAAVTLSQTCYKCIVLFGLIQLWSNFTVFSYNESLGTAQYLFLYCISLFLIAVTMIDTSPSTKLHHRRPFQRIFHVVFLCSFFMQLIIYCGSQYAIIYYLRQLHWYKNHNTVNNTMVTDVQISYEGSVSFITVAFQLVCLATILYQGSPHRTILYLNARAQFFAVAIWVVVAIIAVCPNRFLFKGLNLVNIPDYVFSISIVCLSFGTAFISYVVEKVFMPSRIVQYIVNRLRQRNLSAGNYKSVADQLKAAPIAFGSDVPSK